jgi:pyrophosphatase PpaX
LNGLKAMNKIKAVLFDLDGTLRDTREVIYPALQETVEKHSGAAPSPEQLRPHVHHHTAVHKAFADSVRLETFANDFGVKIEQHRHKTQAYGHADTVIRTLHTRGYRLAIVSSATTAVAYLDSVGLLAFFEVIVGGQDTTEHKPHPEPVEQALTRLKLAPADAVMVGDLPADIQAAKAAGVAVTVGVTHGFGTRELLQQAGADYILESLAELPSVLQTIEQKHR